MSAVYCGAPTHTHIYIYIYIYIYMCDTLPLDNLKIHFHIALPYITWGLIQDLKIKKEIPIEIKIFEWDSKIEKDSSIIICIKKIQEFII